MRVECTGKQLRLSVKNDDGANARLFVCPIRSSLKSREEKRWPAACRNRGGWWCRTSRRRRRRNPIRRPLRAKPPRIGIPALQFFQPSRTQRRLQFAAGVIVADRAGHFDTAPIQPFRLVDPAQLLQRLRRRENRPPSNSDCVRAACMKCRSRSPDRRSSRTPSPAHSG